MKGLKHFSSTCQDPNNKKLANTLCAQITKYTEEFFALFKMDKKIYNFSLLQEIEVYVDNIAKTIDDNLPPWWKPIKKPFLQREKPDITQTVETKGKDLENTLENILGKTPSQYIFATHPNLKSVASQVTLDKLNHAKNKVKEIREEKGKQWKELLDVIENRLLCVTDHVPKNLLLFNEVKEEILNYGQSIEMVEDPGNTSSFWKRTFFIPLPHIGEWRAVEGQALKSILNLPESKLSQAKDKIKCINNLFSRLQTKRNLFFRKTENLNHALINLHHVLKEMFASGLILFHIGPTVKSTFIYILNLEEAAKTCMDPSIKENAKKLCQKLRKMSISFLQATKDVVSFDEENAIKEPKKYRKEALAAINAFIRENYPLKKGKPFFPKEEKEEFALSEIQKEFAQLRAYIKGIKECQCFLPLFNYHTDLRQLANQYTPNDFTEGEKILKKVIQMRKKQAAACKGKSFVFVTEKQASLFEKIVDNFIYRINWVVFYFFKRKKKTPQAQRMVDLFIRKIENPIYPPSSTHFEHLYYIQKAIEEKKMSSQISPEEYKVFSRHSGVQITGSTKSTIPNPERKKEISFPYSLQAKTEEGSVIICVEKREDATLIEKRMTKRLLQKTSAQLAHVFTRPFVENHSSEQMEKEITRILENTNKGTNISLGFAAARLFCKDTKTVIAANFGTPRIFITNTKTGQTKLILKGKETGKIQIIKYNIPNDWKGENIAMWTATCGFWSLLRKNSEELATLFRRANNDMQTIGDTLSVFLQQRSLSIQKDLVSYFSLLRQGEREKKGELENPTFRTSSLENQNNKHLKRHSYEKIPIIYVEQEGGDAPLNSPSVTRGKSAGGLIEKTNHPVPKTYAQKEATEDWRKKREVRKLREKSAREAFEKKHGVSPEYMLEALGNSALEIYVPKQNIQ